MNTDSNGALPPKSPTQTNVTVMTDAGPNPQSLEIRLNIGYFKTAPGIVKILQLVSCSIIYFFAPLGAILSSQFSSFWLRSVSTLSVLSHPLLSLSQIFEGETEPKILYL